MSQNAASRRRLRIRRKRRHLRFADDIAARRSRVLRRLNSPASSDGSGSGSALSQLPDRSGLPSAVRGAGASIRTRPCASRGTLGVLKLGPLGRQRHRTDQQRTTAPEIACLIFASQLNHEVHEGHEVHAGPSSTNLVEGIMPSVWELGIGRINAVLFVSQRDDRVHCSYDHKGWPAGLAVALPEEQKAMPIRHSTWPMRALFTSTLLVVAGFAIGYARQTPPQITRDNVSRLEVAWTYRTGEADARFATAKPAAFEATPLVVDGTMYVGTPLGRVIALDRGDRPRAMGVRSADRARHPVRRFREPRRRRPGSTSRRRRMRRAGGGSSSPPRSRSSSRSTRATDAPARDFGARRHRRSQGRPAYSAVRAAGVLDDLAARRRQRRRRHRLVDRRQQPARPGQRRGARLRRAHRRAASGRGIRFRRTRRSRVRGVARRDGAQERRRERVVGSRRRSRARSRVRADRQRRARLLRRAAARRQPLRELDRRAAGVRPAAWCGRSRPFTTISGTTTTRRRRRSSRSRATARRVPAVLQATKNGHAVRARPRDRRAGLSGRGARRSRERHPGRSRHRGRSRSRRSRRRSARIASPSTGVGNDGRRSRRRAAPRSRRCATRGSSRRRASAARW